MKDKPAGLTPIAGLTGTTGGEDGEINCANPGISAANLLIDRPPAFPEPEEPPAAAAGRGIVPVDVVLAALNCMAVADNGETLIVDRGAAAPTLLFSDEGSLG